MPTKHLRSWELCHAGCECPDCETMRDATVGLTRVICRREAAKAGAGANYGDGCLEGCMDDADTMRLLSDDPAGFMMMVYARLLIRLHEMRDAGLLPME